MPCSKIETVRRAMEAFSRGDLRAALAQSDPECVIDWRRSESPDASVYRGIDEAERFLAGFHDVFACFSAEPQDLIECGRDGVLVPTWTRARGRYGIELQTRNVSFVRFRDGRMWLWRFYLSQEEALADLGLDGGAAAA
jgi:ketosteroid isomerase-like protein